MVLRIGNHSLVDAVKHGLGFNGALHGFTLDAITDDRLGVVQLNGSLLCLGASGFIGVVFGALAGETAGDEKDDANDDKYQDAVHCAAPLAVRASPCAVTMRSTLLPTVSSISAQP